MIYQCDKTEDGLTFPVEVPRVVKFTSAKGRPFTVTRPTEVDLIGHGYFKGNRFPADQPADLKPGEEYGETVLIKGRGVAKVITKKSTKV